LRLKNQKEIDKQKVIWLNESDAVCVQMDCSGIVKQKILWFN